MIVEGLVTTEIVERLLKEGLVSSEVSDGIRRLVTS